MLLFDIENRFDIEKLRNNIYKFKNKLEFE